jgi:fructokinase
MARTHAGGRTVVVLGEALIDLIVAADGSTRALPGGGPFNAARTIARLGGDAVFLGQLSDDRFGRLLREQLLADGVRIGLPDPCLEPTTLAVAELDAGGAATYRFYTAGTSTAALDVAKVSAAWPSGVAAVHVGTLGLVLEPVATTIASLLDAVGPDPLQDDTVPAGPLVFCDPNCRPAAIVDHAGYRLRLNMILARTDVVKVSGDDLAYLSPGVELLTAATELLAAGPSVVLLTDGGEAVHILTAAGDDIIQVPKVDVVDTVGAGDAFGAAFLTWWIDNGNRREQLSDSAALRAAVAQATEVASRTVQRAGANPPLRSELTRCGVFGDH